MSVASELPWEDAVAAIRAADGPVVLACHVGPDGDALGAMLALHLHLRRTGVASIASIGDPLLRIPAQHSGMPGIDGLTAPDQVPDEPALLITLDLNTADRLGSLRRLLPRARQVLVIDHHAADAPFGDVRLVDASASSTVALVEPLLRRLGADVDAELAACLYAGLVTDTGRFQYEGTDAATLALAGRLLDTGLDHAAIARRIYDTHSFGYLKLLGRVLERAAFVPRHGLVHSWFSESDLAWAGCAVSETEPLIDTLRSVDAASVTLLAKHVEGEWRVSLRSDGTVDVATVAAGLDGGGHVRAAGFTYPDVPYAELVAAVTDRIDEPHREVA